MRLPAAPTFFLTLAHDGLPALVFPIPPRIRQIQTAAATTSAEAWFPLPPLPTKVALSQLSTASSVVALAHYRSSCGCSNVILFTLVAFCTCRVSSRVRFGPSYDPELLGGQYREDSSDAHAGRLGHLFPVRPARRVSVFTPVVDRAAFGDIHTRICVP